MKRGTLLAGLIAVLGIAFWLMGAPAGARIFCDNYNFQACSSPGAVMTCTWANGLPGECDCTSSRWICFN